MVPLSRAGRNSRRRAARPLLSLRASPLEKPGVADGTRTRNSQNHNLELYH